MGAAKITVLMATYNGAVFLAEQLDSIASQSLRPERLIISDDGSTDTTQHIIRQFMKRAPFPVLFKDGPKQGMAQNMLSLLRQAPSGYTAFADQDDVWLPNKLARAQKSLSNLPSNLPALYTARRIIADSNLDPIGISPMHRRAPTLANALLQNIAPSNTMVLNSCALSLIQPAIPEALNGPLPFHDWWIYQLVTSSNGYVVSDPAPVLQYRQHNNNILGAGHGLAGRISRLKFLFNGSYGRWIREQATALGRSIHRLNPHAQTQLEQFIIALQGPTIPIRRLGIYRQSNLEQVLLKIASNLGRL